MYNTVKMKLLRNNFKHTQVFNNLSKLFISEEMSHKKDFGRNKHCKYLRMNKC